MPQIAVVGGGILGALGALLAARRGWDVTVYERAPELWTGASAANEGKIHLGPIFALGDASPTRSCKARRSGSLGVVEEAVGADIDWETLRTARFDYLVMPASLSSIERLAIRYRAMNRLRRSVSLRAGNEYLGERLDRIVDARPRRDPPTGLTSFASMERAIDPLRLRTIVVDSLARRDIETLTATRGSRIEHDPRGVEASTPQATRPNRRLRRRDQLCVGAVSRAARRRRSRRIGTSASSAPCESPARPRRNVTLVQGPFGDVVAHRGYTYASWYPRRSPHQRVRDRAVDGFDRLLAGSRPTAAMSPGANSTRSRTRRCSRPRRRNRADRRRHRRPRAAPTSIDAPRRCTAARTIRHHGRRRRSSPP